jgi:hypothetical protein
MEPRIPTGARRTPPRQPPQGCPCSTLPRFCRDWPGSGRRPRARCLPITGRARARKPLAVTYNYPYASGRIRHQWHPGHRRGRIEAAVVADGKHASRPHEA